MNQEERRVYLIRYLIDEYPPSERREIPQNGEEQKKLLRCLRNIRIAKPISKEFLDIQDAYLKEAITEKGITDIEDLKPIQDRLYLFKGDITTIKADAIVNAANKGRTGCYVPRHRCIDNAIHTYAGIELRLLMDRIRKEQGQWEEEGKAKITPAFNLPSRYIIHTVGPQIHYQVTNKDRAALKSCYLSCLNRAKEYGLKSIVFCCLSTGVFGFPQEEAAEIAVKTVREFCKTKDKERKILFNVFKNADERIYRKLLTGN